MRPHPRTSTLDAPASPARRDLLRSAAAATAGLVVPLRSLANDPKAAGGAALGPWIRIQETGLTTLFLSQSEMGQGSYTGLAMLLADELDVDLKRVQVVDSPIGPDYRIRLIDYVGRFTGGSSSTNVLALPLRQAGAAAREMLVEAAAGLWQVPARECEATLGVVTHRASGRRLDYGQLAGNASRLPVPVDPKLKAPAQWRYIGRPVHRLDGSEKVHGRARFGIDAVRPGMLHAVVTHAPTLGGRLKMLNEAEVRALPGVRQIVSVRDEALVIVADSWWRALQAKSKLVVETTGPALAADSGQIEQEMRSLLQGPPGRVARDERPALDSLGPNGGGSIVEAWYAEPYAAHATLEPPCALVDVRADAVEAWLPTQGQDVAVEVLSGLTKLPKDRITVHTTFLGGSFGRKFKPDFVVQATLASMAVKAPVKLVWSREEDIRNDFYRPGFMQRMEGRVDGRGRVRALRVRVATQPLLAQVFAGWVRNGIDEASVEGLADTGYAIPELRVEQHDVQAPVRLGFLRSVGQSPNAFAMESFIDELAAAARRDPYQVRRELLRFDRRGLAVLDTAVRMAGWGRPRPGHALGLAYRGYTGRGGSFITRVAQVAEVARVEGKLRVMRVWCAVDCGLVINPDSVRAQMEGAIAFGLSTALHSKISFERGSVVQSNFDTYPLMQIRDMPQVMVQIIDSREAPSGAGEPGMPPIAPAVANAWFALTGQRLRSMPFADHGVV